MTEQIEIQLQEFDEKSKTIEENEGISEIYPYLLYLKKEEYIEYISNGILLASSAADMFETYIRNRMSEEIHNKFEETP